MGRVYLYVASLVLIGVAIFSMSYHESIRQQQYQLSSAESQTCITLTPDEIAHLKLIGAEALENAFKDQIEKLFSTWMKDDTGQPERARNGVRQAVKAYLSAKRNLETWPRDACF